MPKNLAGVEYPAQPPAFTKDSSINILELFSLKGKVAAISGASAGIGFAVAEAYAQAGAELALWYNSRDPAAKAEELSKKYGVKVKTYKVEVTDSKAIQDSVKQQIADFGKIDIFVANAGVLWTKGDTIDDDNDEEFRKVTEINYNAVGYCARAIGRHFKERGSGSFIVTGSMSGHIINVPNAMSAYAGSKAAATHYAKGLSIEWASFARVNIVSPGYAKTDMTTGNESKYADTWGKQTPMGRIALPKELVGAYLYFASDASTYTTGCDIVVDGGYSAW